MPNVAPRGLFGRHASTWKPPAMVWARVAGAWKQADYVWARQGGTWQLIWARIPAQPATATATWVQPATVRINWTAPAINPNTQWIVRRADGSLVATVPVSTLTVTDTRPLLANGTTANSTVAAYTIEGSDGVTTSAKKSTNTVTFNLTPASQSASVSAPSSGAATVTINWTPNATYGRPQGWQIWEASLGFVGTILPGTQTSASYLTVARGTQQNWRAVPFSQNPDGTWVQAGNANNVPVNVKAEVPINLSLVAPNPPINTLRLSWSPPLSSAYTGFDVEISMNGVQWVHVNDNTSPSDYSPISSPAYMRVRTASAGGTSDWATAGPVTPVSDVTGPGASTISSWMPESSYGRMVVRGNFASDADVTQGAIYYLVSGQNWVTIFGPTSITPGQSFALAAGTFAEGQTITVLVRTWDANGNVSTDAQATYGPLVAASRYFDPVDSGTFRNGAWRTDAIADGGPGVLHGTTTSGENVGCYFYGDALYQAIAGKTFVSASVTYWRVNDQGAGQAISPGIWPHNLTAKGPAPGLAQVQEIGSAVGRTSQTTGECPLSWAFFNQIANGGCKGIAFYRATGTTDPNNPASFYMKLGTGAGYGIMGGRVWLNTLG